jgi:carboxyl-terminal processing protease
MDNDKRGSRVFGVLMLTVVAFCGGVIFGRNISSDLIQNLNFGGTGDVNFTLFWDVWKTLENEYVEEDRVSEEERVYGAIKGMVSSYEDPATVFLTPDETEDFNASNEGKYFEGIGAELGYDNGNIIIVSPLEGSPAKKAGIRPGDYIIAVDDYELKAGDNVYEIVQKIRGEAGTTVTLEILHKGDVQSTTIDIVRSEITVPSITLSFEGDDEEIAVIDITRFTEASLQIWNSKWDSVVEEVKEKGVEKVLIDLRGNPGGYFDAAIYAADDFLDEGILISQQSDGKGNVQDFTATSGGALLGKEVVILVDEGSASASEIFAGALQQNEVATVVGSQTYGKGTAQSVYDLRDGSSIHITILKWLLPDGTWLNRDNSITPDVEIQNTNEDFVAGVDKQYQKALELISR